MNLSQDQITDIFFHLDEFVQQFEQGLGQIPSFNPSNKKYKQRKPKMS